MRSPSTGSRTFDGRDERRAHDGHRLRPLLPVVAGRRRRGAAAVPGEQRADRKATSNCGSGWPGLLRPGSGVLLLGAGSPGRCGDAVSATRDRDPHPGARAPTGLTWSPRVMAIIEKDSEPARIRRACGRVLPQKAGKATSTVVHVTCCFYRRSYLPPAHAGTRVRIPYGLPTVATQLTLDTPQASRARRVGSHRVSRRC